MAASSYGSAVKATTLIVIIDSQPTFLTYGIEASLY